MSKITPEDLIPGLLSASLKAGEAILEIYESDFTFEQKEDKTPLTLADKQSHQIITGYLNRSAGFPVLSEEGKNIPFSQRKDWEYFWLVDPLDGTKEFIKKNGEFTVNIALIFREKPVVGIVYIPVKKTFYFGAAGTGAYKLVQDREVASLVNDAGGSSSKVLFDKIMNRAVRLPVENKKKGFTVIGSRSHMSVDTEDYVNKLKEKHGEIDFISAGSSLKFCLVAEGKADVYPRFGPTMEWDTAAGQVLVEQAGGTVINAESGTSLKYNKENLLNPYFIAGRLQ